LAIPELGSLRLDRTGAAQFRSRLTTWPARRVANRVSDGIRTRDRRDHNPELYQLSYAHQVPQPQSSNRAATPEDGQPTPRGRT
jgi:DNA-directed RNA polymerase specialized sigma24 family protein